MSRASEENFIGAGFSPLQVEVLEAFFGSSSSDTTVVLDPLDFGEFGITAGTGLDSTSGFDDLNDWLNSRGRWTGRSVGGTTQYLLPLPHGRINTDHVWLDFPEGGGGSQANLTITGAGAFANGTVIAPPQTGWDTTNARAAFFSVTGYGFQFDALKLDGIMIWNRWLNAPAWMVGLTVNIDFGYTTVVAVCDSWNWGDVSAKDWNGLPTTVNTHTSTLIDGGNFLGVSAGALVSGPLIQPGTRVVGGPVAGVLTLSLPTLGTVTGSAVQFSYGLPQQWIKAGQNGAGAPVQDWKVRLMIGDRLASGSSLADGIWFSGGHGPMNIDKVKVPARFAASPTCRGLLISPDVRVGLRISAVDSATGTITTVNPHNFKTQDSFQLESSSGTATGGLSLDTDYWIIIDDVTQPKTFRVANSAGNASGRHGIALNSTLGTASIAVNKGGSGGNTIGSNHFQVSAVEGDNNATHGHIRYSRPVKLGSIYAESILRIVDAAGGANSDCYVEIDGPVHAVFGTGASTFGSIAFKTAGEPYCYVRYPGQMYLPGYAILNNGAGAGKGTSRGWTGDSIYGQRSMNYQAVVPTSGTVSTSVNPFIITGVADFTNVQIGKTISGPRLSTFPVAIVTDYDSSAQTVTMSQVPATSGSTVIYFGAATNNMGDPSHLAAWAVTGVITATGDTHTNTTLDNLSATAGIFIGCLVYGPGIAPGTTVASNPSGGSLTLSQATTATAATVALQFGMGRLDVNWDGLDRSIRIPGAGTDAAPATCSFITSVATDGDRMRIGVGSGNFVEFDVRGGGTFSNIAYSGHSTNNTLRCPSGTSIDIIFSIGLGSICNASIVALVMPPHTFTWAGNLLTNASVTGVTRSGTDATATTFSTHNLLVGDIVIVSGAAQAEYNILAPITAVNAGAKTFTYTVAGAPVTPATGTINYMVPKRRAIVTALGARPGDPLGTVQPGGTPSALPTGVTLVAYASAVDQMTVEASYNMPLYNSAGVFVGVATTLPQGTWSVVQGR